MIHQNDARSGGASTSVFLDKKLPQFGDSSGVTHKSAGMCRQIQPWKYPRGLGKIPNTIPILVFTNY